MYVKVVSLSGTARIDKVNDTKCLKTQNRNFDLENRILKTSSDMFHKDEKEKSFEYTEVCQLKYY